MGLRDTLQKAAQAVIAATGDIAETSVYLAFGSSTYNASAGSAVVAMATTESVPVIFDVFHFREIDGEAIQPGDRKAIIAALDLPGVSPSVRDQIRLSNGEVWRVHSTESDPAGAHYMLHVRRAVP